MTDRAMTERHRELLSALMDGEASEHEVRQALRAVGDDPALAAAWRRYHLAQSALRGDHPGFAGMDLRQAVAGRLDGEPVAAAPARRAWLKPLASVAVAASVTVMTVFAWQAFRDASVVAPGDTVAAAAPAAGQHVALGPMVVVREDGEELVIPATGAAAGGDVMVASLEAPTAAQDRLNAYLARHAQAAGAANARGLAPYARVVSMEGEQGQ